VGNLSGYGEHIAWSESSAVCYANAILGARSNREGGPSALAAALTGCTPEYGYHLLENRLPGVVVEVQATLEETSDFGALGFVIGEWLEGQAKKPVAYLRAGRAIFSLENLKSLCASLATFGGAAMFHIEGVTPEAEWAGAHLEGLPGLRITTASLEAGRGRLTIASPDEVDFVSLGCPHLTIQEIARIAELLAGRRVKKEFWITAARPVKQIADRLGYTATIEVAGAKFAVDTCCVVAPIRGRFTAMATDSAKACYYAAGKNQFKTIFLPFDEVVKRALA
jgi:hypothetical protein